MIENRHMLILTLLSYIPRLASRELISSPLRCLLPMNTIALLQDPINQPNNLFAINLHTLVLLLRILFNLVSDFDKFIFCFHI